MLEVGPARDGEADSIAAVLAANAEDLSLFQRDAPDVARHLGDFVVARDGDRIVGCAALKVHAPWLAEILSVSVLPERQGTGVGRRLVAACEARAAELGIATVCLATVKASYFARFGYAAGSRWAFLLRAAGPGVALNKLGAVFSQPPGRWVPALLGRHTWMRRDLGGARR